MSDTNNNIPTRITQLEEATEYEDGMFFAVAKAGRGTYKIPVDEMTPNEQALSDKIENEIVPAVENSFAYGTVDESEIASFPDGSNLPMPKLEVAVEPQQEGSGDPSPTNIRPISGWDECNVSVEGGQNLYNDSIVWKNGYYINSSGAETQSNNYKYTQTFIEVEPSTTYSIQADIVALTDLAITVPYYSEQQSFISRGLVANVDIGTRTYKVDFTTPSNCKYIRISVPTDTSNIVIHKKIIITIDLDGTRYGGKLDVVSGVLSVVPYYASYNGETLVGEWISDRDKYEVGTTPTIGAQVVNIGATPTTIQLTPTQVSSLMGVNNIFANTGNILKVEYIRDLDIVINSLLERIAALEG